MICISREHACLLMEVAEAVGRRFARQYPTQSAEEITGEVITQALAQWNHIYNKLVESVDYERTEREVLFFLLSQRASVFCGREHYAYMLANPQAAVYTPREVRALLKECYYHPDSYTTPGRDTEHGTAVDAKSVWCNLADIKEALNRVSSRVHDTILAAFGPEDLGLEQPDKRRLSEAVAAVTRELNRHLNKSQAHHEGPGARRVVPNAAAINRTRQQERHA